MSISPSKGYLFSWISDYPESTFASLELQTGPLSVPDVKEYINLGPLAKRGSDVLDLLTDGTITVKKLSYTEPRPFRAEFYLADVAAAYQKIEVRDVEGAVSLDEQKMMFSHAKGSYQREQVL